MLANLVNLAADLSVNGFGDYGTVLTNVKISQVMDFYRSKAFKDHEKLKEWQNSVASQTISRLDNVIHGLVGLGKLIASRPTL